MGPEQVTPSGTVTFLFTDIEGSTKRWEQYHQAMQVAHSRQEVILREAITAHGGYAYKMIGDAFQAAFSTAPQALSAALTAQRALHAEQWGEQVGPIRVRMALHAGITEERGTDYVGPLLNRVARLLSTGYGGQTLLTQAAYELVVDNLPEGITLSYLGEHHLKDLQRPERVYQMVAPDVPSEFPPIKSLDYRPNNLPVQRSPLIGREKETAEIAELLLRDQVGLLTLVGPGGVGKTRLALQVAAEVIEHFADGVFFVALAPISDAGLVPSSIAQALGVREEAGQPLSERVTEYLRDKQLLLVLDNFEQVSGAATLVSDLLGSSPKVKVLVTSREVLRVYGGRDYHVLPLGVPDPAHLPPNEELAEYEAVRLFLERAQAVKSGFALTTENALAIARICHRLDGLPLAIELAAARVTVLPPQAILERLNSRLKLLTGGARDLPARQQTLRGAIAWSYDLLTEDEQALFRRMSVFVGGGTLDAAETVCNPDAHSEHAFPTTGEQPRTPLQIDVFDGITSLVDKSLLRQEERAGGEACFVMLETLREFGLERLVEAGEEEATRYHHTEFFLDLSERAAPELQGPQQGEWLDRLEAEHDNLRAALGWALDHREVELALRLCVALWGFWFIQGHLSEGRRGLETTLAQSNDMKTDLRAKALYVAGRLVYSQGDYEQAKTLYEESLALSRELDNKQGIADALVGMGLMAHDQGDLAQARAFYEDGLSTYRELGDQRAIASSLYRLANVAGAMDDYEAARTFREESLPIFRELGNKTGIASTLNDLGEEARRQGDYNSARSYYEESFQIFQEARHKQGMAHALHNAGRIAHHQNEFERAVGLFAESLALHSDLGSKLGICECLSGLGGVAGAQGDYERSAQLFAATEALLEGIGASLAAADRAEFERDVESCRFTLDEETFAQAWAKGRAMSLEQAVEYATQLAPTSPGAPATA